MYAMSDQHEYRILLVGGGTGGHSYPLVAVGESLRELFKARNASLRLACMGSGDFLKDAAAQLNVPFISISGAKWDRSSPLKLALAFLSIPLRILSFAKALYWMWRFLPDAVFTKGGYASFLPVIAAKCFFIPVYIHESDAIAGKTNIFLARFAEKIFISFGDAAPFFDSQKTEFTGLPIRKPVIVQDPQQARMFWKFDPSRPTIFISGSSQGAQALNDIVLLSFNRLIEKFNVIHQCGGNNHADVNTAIERLKKEQPGLVSVIDLQYRLESFLSGERLQQAIMAADVIITRGSSQMLEFAAYQKPIIAVPLPTAANDHQRANAYAMAQFGVHVVEQSNLTPNLLIYEIEQVLKEQATLAQRLRGFDFSAADKIAQSIVSNISP